LAVTDHSEGSESRHSGCILPMPNGTPRTAWANVATIGGALAGCAAATAQASGTIHCEKSKENRNDAKGY
jgi:hypothetical protein